MSVHAHASVKKPEHILSPIAAMGQILISPAEHFMLTRVLEPTALPLLHRLRASPQPPPAPHSVAQALQPG